MNFILSVTKDDSVVINKEFELRITDSNNITLSSLPHTDEKGQIAFELGEGSTFELLGNGD